MSSEMMSPSSQRTVRRDPVHDLLVHRRAQRRRIPAIPLERRLGAAVAHQLLRRRVEIRRRHARRHHRRQLREHLARRARSPRASARAPPATCRRSQCAPRVRPLRSPRRAPRRRAAVTASGGWLPSIDLKCRPARVVLDERLGLPLIHLQPLPHDPVAVVARA